MATELDTLEEDQRKFVSNVSHDFRSPLTSIKGYVEAMLDGTIPVEMQDKYFKHHPFLRPRGLISSPRVL